MALSCFDVTKVFDGGDRGVFNVSLDVPAGTAYALLGPNGSGKTTLINLCLGYLIPDSGRIEIDGLDVVAAPTDAKLRVSYIPEVARLYSHMTAREHLVFFDRLMGKTGRDEVHRSMLDLLRFPAAAAGDPVRTYSKGMRQKVALALGLLKGADVFLLDEPTSGLDPRSNAEFTAVIARLKSEGNAILMATHDIAHLSSLADRVGILKNGRLMRECSPHELSHDFVDWTDD